MIKVPIAGGTPVMLAMGATAAQLPWDVAVDGGAVYWNEYASPGSVMTAPVAGGAAAAVAAQQNGPRNLAIAGGNVFSINLWILGNDSGAVMKAPVAGGAPIALASAQDNPNGIAVDGESVYWANLGGTMVKLPIAGGAAVTLASAQPGPQMAVDATNVYWTNIGSVDDTGSRDGGGEGWRDADGARDGATGPVRHRRRRGQRLLDGRLAGDEGADRRRRRAGRGGIGAAARDRHRGGRDEHLLDRHGRGTDHEDREVTAPVAGTPLTLDPIQPPEKKIAAHVDRARPRSSPRWR